MIWPSIIAQGPWTQNRTRQTRIANKTKSERETDRECHTSGECSETDLVAFSIIRIFVCREFQTDARCGERAVLILGGRLTNYYYRGRGISRATKSYKITRARSSGNRQRWNGIRTYVLYLRKVTSWVKTSETAGKIVLRFDRSQGTRLNKKLATDLCVVQTLQY